MKTTGLEASDPRVSTSVFGPDEVHLYESGDQHGNWMECILSRQEPISLVEKGHRACSTCLVHHIAMHAEGKHLHWDPERERFRNDEAANARLARPQRAPYTFSA